MFKWPSTHANMQRPIHNGILKGTVKEKWKGVKDETWES